MENRPIFHDVDRRAITAAIVEEDGKHLLLIEEVAEDGSDQRTRLLILNTYDAKQLANACENYLSFKHTIDYSSLNTMLTDKDRIELYGEEDD